MQPFSSYVALRQEAARRVGLEVEVLDSSTGYLYTVGNESGRKLMFGGKSPLNDAVAARIATDKFYTAMALDHAGFRVPETARCLKPGHFGDDEYTEQTGLAPAFAMADAHGFPLIVKPNSGSRGRGIRLVDSREELRDAIEAVWPKDYLALVQTVAEGIDLRLDFLTGTPDPEGEYLFGYVRRPVVLVGDGTRTLEDLLLALDPRFQEDHPWRELAEEPAIRALFGDSAPDRAVLRSKVLAADITLDFSRPIMNLNRLCFADYLPEISQAWLDHARSIGRTLGLRHFGIDFKVPKADIEASPPAGRPDKAVVIEVNASPSVLQMANARNRNEALAAEMRVMGAVKRLL